jgi:hypothetical protein
MPLQKGSKVSRGYATVSEDDGVNYRDISETMTELGFKMNHSSARNYVIRVMKKFAVAYSDHFNRDLSEEQLNEVVRSPDFQATIADVLQTIESQRRASNKAKR